MLELSLGFTALVGPNGAGKTTILSQIKEFANQNNIAIWEYSNIHDGGSMATNSYLMRSELSKLATAAMASEGENVALNFANKVGELGVAIRKAATEKYPLIVLLDAIDSGASIDRARDLVNLFHMIYKRDISRGAEVYIVMAVNHFELAKGDTDCVNVRTGEHMRFRSYDEYADFICTFMDKFKGGH